MYGFLAILFKIIEDIEPKYLGVAFDLRAPTHRHKLYSEYKATRKGMPDELAQQMPILKEILSAMNIKIIEQEGYEADDILGTLAKYGQRRGVEVTILTGDRDSFQLIDHDIKVRIPRTKQGKTETEDYDIEKIKEEYGLMPKDLIEVKGLMGDKSDNIPGVPGIGEKTALNMIKDYNTIEGVYKNIDNFKGKLKEKLEENEELAYLSRQLGTIDVKAPIEKDLDSLEVKPWNTGKVLELFKKLKFNRYIERFNLQGEQKETAQEIEIKYEEIISEEKIELLKKEIINDKIMFYYLEVDKNSDNIVDKKISGIHVFSAKDEKAYLVKDVLNFKDIFENEEILKCGYKQKEDWILLKNQKIDVNNLMFDIEIAGYILNSTISKYTIEYLANEYLRI